MKKIVIFAQEISDNVAQLIESQASIAYCSEINILDLNKEEVITEELKKVIAGNQSDLYYIESVLVSTGWNKNDDVFISSETWEARNSPEDKQFNFMHDENDIIGHITGSYILDKNGNKVIGDQEVSPLDFDIITQAVIYNSWTDPENRDRMSKIIAEIEEGKWFVSMECLFSDFDYAISRENEENKIIARTEKSAYLTKHLRTYGGTGEYAGYKIGRALKNISFSGKGLVSKPANPRSVILNFSKAETDNNTLLDLINIGDSKMAKEKKTSEEEVKIEETKVEATELQKEVVTVEVNGSKLIIEKLEASITEKDSQISSLEDNIKSTQARIAELQDALNQSNQHLEAAKHEMEDMKKKDKMSKRMASLVEAGFDETEASESISLYDTLSDEAFETVVAKWKNKFFFKKKDKDEEKKKDEDTTKSSVQADEVLEVLFEKVESTEAALVEAKDEEDELLTTRASISEWLKTNVLNLK